KLSPFLPGMGQEWTEQTHLPGGDFHPNGFEEEVQKLLNHVPLLEKLHATRLFRTYGSCTYEMTAGIKDISDMGPLFGHDLYGFEVDYLIAHEWAQNTEDILWRRTKLGLFLS